MMRAREHRTASGYLPAPKIERAASELLRGYATQFGVTIAAPIPVEEIVESHLGLDLQLDDLLVRSGDANRLGEICIGARRITIEESLDPTLYPEREGRYRFTVAHEGGHWVLHRHLIASAEQSLLMADQTAPTLICRAGRSRDPKEWQANQFAAFLLMPRDLVYAAWRDLYGALAPYQAAEEIADLSAQWGLGEDEVPTVGIARELAALFRVSGQAMQIRLVGLKLIRTEAPAPALF